MSDQNDRIRELSGWDFDAYEYRAATYDRGKWADARRIVTQRAPFEAANAMILEESEKFRDAFSVQAARRDLQAEMAGLDWSLGVVDLRLLLAFQRRLCFNASAGSVVDPAQIEDLLTLAFGPAKTISFDLVHAETNRNLVLESRDPNLHFRFSTEGSTPVIVHAGSPFFEVGRYRGRWFLRDGYHRAYALLRAGIFTLPAVIVQARTLEELGANQPWFFPEDVLLSDSPPLVTDFLDAALTIEYERPPLIKTLRIAIEETFAPAVSQGGSS
ncbi:hypothetical protein HNQ77_000872 [Silvibacterium bohemicum]|uniref:Uncharacterized protein n=1 Tax=Silvibacterium bohemicum TaxID=1577686 RepID=A0A841JWW2_9BACT|nr:hypothetical protein [Silvibacterium bohemicum]MBB6142928.1 hypothetical protein [Silvibacterium bohemicum]